MSDRFTFTQPASTAVTIGLGWLLAFNTVATWAAMALVIKWRRSNVIAHRNPARLISCLVYWWFLSLLTAISIMVGKPAFCLPLNLVISLLFLFNSYFLLTISKIVLQHKLGQAVASRMITPYGLLANNYLKKQFYGFAITMMVAAIYVVFLWATASRVGYEYNLITGGITTTPTNDCLQVAVTTAIFYIWLLIILQLYFIIKLFMVSDPYFMRLELLISAVVYMLPLALLEIVYILAPQRFGDDFDQRWILVVISPCITIINGWLPLLLTRQSVFTRLTDTMRWTEERQLGESAALELPVKQPFVRVSNSDGSSSGPNNGPNSGSNSGPNSNNRLSVADEDTLMKRTGSQLMDVIFNNAATLAAFKAFATSRWAIENVLFYEEVVKFRSRSIGKQSVNRQSDEWTHEQQLAEANRIYSVYLTPDSPYEVNVDSDICSAIVAAIVNGNVDNHLFNAAQRQVAANMEQDTLFQWKRTIAFRRRAEALVNIAGNSARPAAELSSIGMLASDRSNSYSSGMLTSGRANSYSGSQLPMLNSSV